MYVILPYLTLVLMLGSLLSVVLVIGDASAHRVGGTTGDCPKYRHAMHLMIPQSIKSC